MLLKFFQHGQNNVLEYVSEKVHAIIGNEVVCKVDLEFCFYIELKSNKLDLTVQELTTLKWLLSVPFEEDVYTESTLKEAPNSFLFEVGPRLSFCTPFSTNCVSICHSVGLSHVTRVERSSRYLVHFFDATVSPSAKTQLISSMHDCMTECIYKIQLDSFELLTIPEEVYNFDVVRHGKAALQQANDMLGLAFDEQDVDYYTEIFAERQRNPTNVELFDLAQSNSEHSRHWFFKGKLVIDGTEMPGTLFSAVMSTCDHSNLNNVIKFNDNSSAILGHKTKALVSADGFCPSPFLVREQETRHITFTAETHNFPTGVAPFPGAATGTGGRIRDVQSTGRGAHVIAGTVGYAFGNLLLPGYHLPWEAMDEEYPSNFASPSQIAIGASDGASDYGNKFGEPLLTGFARSFGLRLHCGERREYVKPIMFSGGIGTLSVELVEKMAPCTGMEVVKVGGPVYKIGVGGGSASSVKVQGDNNEDLDFGAVQRGDPEMEQKMNRLVRACVELGLDNPICCIHDQGAGGNGNVLKEIVDPAGALILCEKFHLGDPTVSVLELWCAEYQESNALLVHQSRCGELRKLGRRERCPVAFVGSITNSGKIQLEDFPDRNKNGQLPVDLDLNRVLASMPQKVFELFHMKRTLHPLSLPENLKVCEALSRVLRLHSVASKRYLTNKVDRSVTGLVAQQQCVGPLHTPLADVAVVSTSYFDLVGTCTAIGEQPIKMLVDPSCGARMTVAEALTNLVFARVTDLRDVKCSANWMWPAKLPGEGAALVDACVAMCSVMKQLGIAVDGGKDSLSMAARIQSEVVKAPGTLVVSAYAPCPDITATVTPDLKCPDGGGRLVWVSIGRSLDGRLGGSALAQCYRQVGDEVPDIDEPHLLVQAFNVLQGLLKDGSVTSGHDVSDGGLITCLLEMAFAGNCGISVNIMSHEIMKHDRAAGDVFSIFFAEEVGFVLETRISDADNIMHLFTTAGVACYCVGTSVARQPILPSKVRIVLDGSVLLDTGVSDLRDVWEETGFQLERLQTNRICVEREQELLKTRRSPPYCLTFDPDTCPFTCQPGIVPRVAVLREEGSNGDREMAAAFYMAGFETWDVNMQDLMDEAVSLDIFRGVVFVGGFSYADVCGSAKGWAATARFNGIVRSELERFKSRPDTFSFGVCNGCQLMALLGWIVPDEHESQGVLLSRNDAGSFQSRFSTVRVASSSAVMLRGMHGTMFGMWIAHGEGKFVFKTEHLHKQIKLQQLEVLHYVNDDGDPTENYPYNPNGSPGGLAGICSADGRHLAIMPHPERCVFAWQCPWMPEQMKKTLKHTPWFRMFQNTYDWCVELEA